MCVLWPLFLLFTVSIAAPSLAQCVGQLYKWPVVIPASARIHLLANPSSVVPEHVGGTAARAVCTRAYTLLLTFGSGRQRAHLSHAFSLGPYVPSSSVVSCHDIICPMNRPGWPEIEPQPSADNPQRARLHMSKLGGKPSPNPACRRLAIIWRIWTKEPKLSQALRPQLLLPFLATKIHVKWWQKKQNYPGTRTSELSLWK